MKGSPHVRGLQDEVSKLGSTLRSAAVDGEEPSLKHDLSEVEKVCDELKHSASGSWLGYHAFVYYESLTPAPAGANFSQEWGLEDLSYTRMGSVGDWRQFDARAVEQHIFSAAGVSSLKESEARSVRARRTYDAARSELSSVFEVMPEAVKDAHLSALYDEFQALKAPSSAEVIRAWRPGGQIITRDSLALGQGWKTPPHLSVLSEVVSIRLSYAACDAAAEICQRMGSHLRRKGNMTKELTPSRIFIGHGQSLAWRELKDFLQDRLALPWNEFNRVSAAGVPTTIRLGQMLDDSRFALLVLTAEDETAVGNMQARMNVLHEVGLFQGRLGFSKAIVLLEDGCVEFSNIAGLGQIRFPKGKISAVFEQVREVLEREQIV